MKRIYKRIEVASSELLLTLALFSDVGSTESVDAADLDRLEAQLSRPNYTGAEQLPVANVQRSHLEITNEGEVLAVLHRLKRGENIFVCKARYGTNISVQLTIDFVVTDPNETTPVEMSENVVLVESIGDGGGGEFPTDYAKQGTDPNATLTDTQAYAQSAASDAAAAKTAAQSLTSLDSDINAGKAAIAQAVTAKGVQTSPTDTMLQMATNVTQITQAPISINGGEMYAKQLYGSLTTPNYWNLYEVMANLLSDGRLNNYGGILLAEYYKGYDSIALSGAGAGGAYVVSDKDSDGNFIMYTEDTTHTWDTEFDGKGNRWVAYCFADEWHDFQITDTNTSPRNIFIGRNIGTITNLTNGRHSQLVITDGNKLRRFNQNSYSNTWQQRVVVRNLEQGLGLFDNATNIVSAYVEVDNLDGLCYGRGINFSLDTLIVKANSASSTLFSLTGSNAVFRNLITLCLNVQSGSISLGDYTKGLQLLGLKTIILCGHNFALSNGNVESGIPSATVVYFTYEGAAKDGGSLSFTGNSTDSLNCWKIISDVRLQEGWCKNIDISLCKALTEANMYTYILQLLKQDEPDCGDGVTITLGQTNLDKLTSQESIDLLDALTNTYGYTFA